MDIRLAGAMDGITAGISIAGGISIGAFR